MAAATRDFVIRLYAMETAVALRCSDAEFVRAAASALEAALRTAATTALPPPLRSRFSELLAGLVRAAQRRDGAALRAYALPALQRFLNSKEAEGLRGTALCTEAARALLPGREQPRGRHLLAAVARFADRRALRRSLNSKQVALLEAAV